MSRPKKCRELRSRKKLLKLLDKPEKISVNFYMKQKDLINLATSDIGGKLKELEIHPEYEEGRPVLDFSQVQFPALESLEIHYQGIEAIDFT